MPAKPYAAISISTHAPAGGATGQEPLIVRRMMISTHAPAGGATVVIDPNTQSVVFLLTPLREGRLARFQNGHVVAGISTHAPAGGATKSCG